MPLTVLDGSTFCVCDERGDVDGIATASGFFASDTRFLSRSVLTLGGERLEPLSYDQPAPHIAAFVLRNPIVEGSVASATAMQLGHGKIWYVEVKLTDAVAQKLAQAVPSMTGQQLAFSYNGKVLTSIAIDQNFHPSHFAITGAYQKASATTLAQELSG